MILEIVSFELPDGMSDTELLDDARSVVDHWRANQSLVRKYFVKGDGKAAGIYIWPDLASAERAHDAAWVERFRTRTGVEPGIERLDLFMEIDNFAGAVREFGFAL